MRLKGPNLSRHTKLVLAVISILASAGCARKHEIDDAALRDADADSANWLTYGRTYAEQRFSPLKQIDEQSVSKLGLAWSYDMRTLRGGETTPLVNDGVMYATAAWSIVYALDAQSGKLLWKFDPEVAKDHAKYVCCDVVNRGVAFYKGRVYLGVLDGRLVALDAKTGAKVWEVQTTPSKDSSYAITGAPRIAKGRVIIGNAGAEYPVRGYVSAYDADTGNLAWRTYTVPGDPSKPFESDALKRAAATWSGEWWKAGGGGTAWDAIVYDPELDYVYFGTGNGSPWYDRIRGTGDNLYIASIIAVRADNGDQVWAYQATPGDNWDYDATQPLMLATLTIGGAPRRVVMQANKNGFFYVISRESGTLISAGTYAPINWANGMDSNGRPIENAEARKFKDAALVAPSAEGAHNWHPFSYSPATGFVYLPVLQDVQIHAVMSDFKLNLHDQTTGYDRAYRGPARDAALKMAPKGRLLAWDPVNQKEGWHVDLPNPKNGGTLATAGNLVFQGRSDGKLCAYRATDGKQLWEFGTQIGVAAPPMTYSVDGVQYVAVLTGWGGPQVLGNRAAGKGKVGPGQLLAFRIGGTAALAPYERTVGPVPMPTFKLASTTADVEKGRVIYANFCSRCHGGDVVSGGEVPDLRYAAESTHEAFEDIVLGGQRRVLGMPSFEGDITSDQVKLIHAYILQRARESAQAERAAK
jgi:quinohemoprotein ethanol dehydrogenase